MLSVSFSHPCCTDRSATEYSRRCPSRNIVLPFVNRGCGAGYVIVKRYNVSIRKLVQRWCSGRVSEIWVEKVEIGMDFLTVFRAGINLAETVNQYAILYSKDARRN